MIQYRCICQNTMIVPSDTKHLIQNCTCLCKADANIDVPLILIPLVISTETSADISLPLFSVILSIPAATMSFVPTPSPTVVDQTTLMKKYLQFVAALTDNNTRECIPFN